jgi:hypothetical protein
MKLYINPWPPGVGVGRVHNQVNHFYMCLYGETLANMTLVNNVAPEPLVL